MEQSTREAGKTMAIISYIWFIGLLIAYFSNQGASKNEFVSFHVGQSLRVWILYIILVVGGSLLVMITGIGFFDYLPYLGWVLAILGIVNAMNLKEEKLPIIGTVGEK